MVQPRILSNAAPDRANFAFDGGIAVSVGDLMFLDTNDVKPARSQEDQASESNNQDYFAARFAGVAMDGRTVNDGAVDRFPVATDVTAEYDCASSTFEVGDYVTVDEAGSGTALLNQTLVKTADPNKAIGRCVQRYGSATTRVVVRLMSTVLPNVAGPTIPALGETVVAVTATSNGLATGMIPEYAKFVTAASGDDDHIISLPSAVVGKQIVITPAAICELQTLAGSNQTINGVDSDGTNELALVAGSVYHLRCVAANTWIANGWGSNGAALATLTPNTA